MPVIVAMGFAALNPSYGLTALGQDLQITVKPTRKARGEMAVVAR